MKLFTLISTVRNFSIACISLVLVHSLPSYACGPDFTGFQYSLLLEHYQIGDKFYPYQYDPDGKFYSLSWTDEKPNDDRLYNIKTWREYLHLSNEVPDSDLIQFIYQNSSKRMIQLNQTGKGISFMEKSIFNQKNSGEILAYLELMNEYKEIIVRPQDAWDYSSYTDSVSLDTVKPFIARCEKLMARTKDPFLQWRSLYLILRAAHFNRYYAFAIEKFDAYYSKLDKQNSLAQFWCEGIYAGALLRTGKEDLSIYYSARAFAHCPDQHLQAMTTYLQSNRNWKAALPYCKNAHDSVYVVLLEGAHHKLPDLEFTQWVYKTNPQSEVLKLLWLREAMKMQNYWRIVGYKESDLSMYMGAEEFFIDSFYEHGSIMKDFVSLSEEILANPNELPVKSTVASCLAFYHYEKGNYEKALNVLNQASAWRKDKMETLQYDLLKQLVELKRSESVRPEQLMTLMRQFKAIPAGSTNRHIGYYFMHNEIAPMFLNKHDTITAFWCYVYAHSFENESFDLYDQDYSPESFGYSNFATYLLNHHFSIEQILELKKNYIQQKGSSAFETALIQGCTFTNGLQLFNLVMARKYMLKEEWDKALAMLPDLPSSYQELMGPNPANFYIPDYIQDEVQTFSVKKILELMVKLKTTSATSSRDKLLYARSLYNLSYYGKNHYILDNHWNHTLSLAPYSDNDSINTHFYNDRRDQYQGPLHPDYQNYFHLKLTEKILAEALDGLSTEEEKAQCLFMLAKCWQKQCPSNILRQEDGTNSSEDYLSRSLKNPYFQTLERQYGNTKTRELVFNSCSYYSMFLSKK